MSITRRTLLGRSLGLGTATLFSLNITPRSTWASFLEDSAEPIAKGSPTSARAPG